MKDGNKGGAGGGKAPFCIDYMYSTVNPVKG